MSVLLIIADGVADEPIPALGYKTPLEVAHKPTLDLISRLGQNGVLKSVPDDWDVGSDTACLSILGYELNQSYPGRSSLEASQLNIPIKENELVMRCNLITVEDNHISSFTADHISTPEASELISYLNSELGSEEIAFYTGNSYRHILKIKSVSNALKCNSPHNYIQADKSYLHVTPLEENAVRAASILNGITDRSLEILSQHPININRIKQGLKPANAISLWAPGTTPQFMPFSSMYPITKGAVISAVDLINGIGGLIGLDIIKVDGATGQSNTNYEGKANAALKALEKNDFVLLHIEAPDEASHDGDIELKIKTIEDIDQKVLAPIFTEINKKDKNTLIAVLPDHITSTLQKIHLRGDVPFVIYHPQLSPDETIFFSEKDATTGRFNIQQTTDFMQLIYATQNALNL